MSSNLSTHLDNIAAQLTAAALNTVPRSKDVSHNNELAEKTIALFMLIKKELREKHQDY